jgi:hypothetical protein
VTAPGISLRRIQRPLRSGHVRGQLGQAMLFVGVMFVFLLGVVGLAVDGGVGYVYSLSVERAAAAAALAGVPYMPDQFSTPAGGPNATTRALDEASRNGYANSPPTTVVPKRSPTGDRDLAVTITTTAPTFFMQALGMNSIVIKRTAIAGYLPTIALGQPGAQMGSTVAQLGAGAHFDFPRFKGWDNNRSEGDAYTPNPLDSSGSTSTDVHQISHQQGTEDPEIAACGGPGSLGPAWQLPCRGGFNYQVIVPTGSTAQLVIYNMANAPNKSGADNACDNSRNVNNCNASGYSYHEGDNGTQCPCAGSAAKQGTYDAAAYTLFKVNDLFLRQNDVALVQTVVKPIDATNWDGNSGGTGKGSAATPTYQDVNNDSVITQNYNGAGVGATPKNMLIYHAWAPLDYSPQASTDALPAKTDEATSLVTTRFSGWSAGTGHVLGPGTYRLRIDALKFDGTVANSGTASHGWSVRAISPIGDPNAAAAVDCPGCQVQAWQDLTVYTPLQAGVGVVPLFELPADYAGATIEVDVFDVGDSSGTVNLSILDYNKVVATTGSATPMNIWNMGVNRFNTDQTCASSCTAHSGNQFPLPKGLGSVAPHVPANAATYEAANNAYVDSGGNRGPEYQGSWIRIEIPIPANYSPPASPGDYWYLQYANTGGANDTFTYAVQAKGGPVRLKNS